MWCVQIISFLRRESERKDELIESLKATITQQRDMFAQQREQEMGSTAAARQQAEGAMQKEIASLKAQLDAAQARKAHVQQTLLYLLPGGGEIYCGGRARSLLHPACSAVQHCTGWLLTEWLRLTSG